MRFYHIFGQERLLVADPELVRHILVTNSSNYIRPKSQAISELANEGLLSLEGVLHRSERKLLNPAFNHSAIASMCDEILYIYSSLKNPLIFSKLPGFLPLFKRKATELIDEIERMVQTESTGDGVHVDMQRYIKSTVSHIELSVQPFLALVTMLLNVPGRRWMLLDWLASTMTSPPSNILTVN